jgi:hypothetical protein
VPLKRSFFSPAPPAQPAPSARHASPTLDQPPDTRLDSGFDEDVSAFDPDRPPSIDELKARRRPQSDGDRRVSDEALSWMAALPRDRRLMHTMLDYPHVVNSLAQRWSDRTLLSQYFESLLHGKRRRREGFSALSQAELTALADWAHAQGLVDDSPTPLINPR